MTDMQLAEIEGRLNAPMMRLWHEALDAILVPRLATHYYAIGNTVYLLSPEEVTLIAYAPADIATLIAEVRRLRSENSSLRADRSAHEAGDEMLMGLMGLDDGS